jgi:hypothetical protein
LPRRKRDRLANVVAGQLGVSAVLANVLIDKGIVSREELCDRFCQAHDAALSSVGGDETARLLAAMVCYLKPDLSARHPH